LSDKILVIEKLGRNASQNVVAKNFGISQSEVPRIWKAKLEESPSGLPLEISFRRCWQQVQTCQTNNTWKVFWKWMMCSFLCCICLIFLGTCCQLNNVHRSCLLYSKLMWGGWVRVQQCYQFSEFAACFGGESWAAVAKIVYSDKLSRKTGDELRCI